MGHSTTALRAPVVVAPTLRQAPDAPLPSRAGWYPDPERRATTRFFDGSDWTEHTRGPAPLAALTEAAKARRAVEARCYGRFENRPASASIAVGAVSIVLNPLFVPSIVAIVLGMKGLRRSRLSLARYGRERALAGIALATVGMATAAVTLVAVVALLTPGFERAQHAAATAAVHSAVVQHVADRGAALASLSCPPARPGVTLQCTAVTVGHAHWKLHVLMPEDGTAVQVTDVAPPVRIAPPHHSRH